MRTHSGRPGISSTDEEKQAALDRVNAVRQQMTEWHWPAPILADSGNGWHLLYRIDQPVDDGGLVERCLKALDQRFSDSQVKIDTTVHNPARITKCYGTWARKGDSTPTRPHRQSRILEVPDA